MPADLTGAGKMSRYMPKALIRKLAETEYVRSAITDRANLSAFRERPTPRIIFGLCIIGLSYTIGWPAIAALGAISVYFQKPVIVAVGGPVMYGLSHLTFTVGAYFAGAKYTRVFMRWLTRVAMERLLGAPPPADPSVETGVRQDRGPSKPEQQGR